VIRFEGVHVMKMSDLRNDTGARFSIPQIRGLVFEPGETKKVHPATVLHPAVSRHLGKGLTLVEPTQMKVEPSAPVPSAVAPSAVSKVVIEPVPVKQPEPTPQPEPEVIPEPVVVPELVVEPQPEPQVETPKVVEETAGINLRETYLLAPGVTETNVDALLKACPTLEKLANANREKLCDLGVSVSYTKRLKTWANSQLNS
jgi:hypothetical protein